MIRKERSLDNNDSAIDEVDSGIYIFQYSYLNILADDDGGAEEEDSFMGFTGSKLLGDAADENADDQMNSDDDMERSLTGHGVSGSILNQKVN